MMRRALGAVCQACLLLAFAGMPAWAADTGAPDTDPAGASARALSMPAALRGDHFSIDFDDTGDSGGATPRTLQIHVRLPEGHADQPDRRWPVVYVLDGDSLFPILAASHLFLHYDDGLPEAIVVGIAYGGFDPALNRRTYDFSSSGEDSGPQHGGAERFQAFLKQRLLPLVESRYGGDPARRVLFGQSRGGHFVLYSAWTDPNLFWGRIASNPAFHPGKGRFHAAPAAASRTDLALVVTSGSEDRLGELRADALAWQAAWRGREQQLPWRLQVHTVPGGTHSADSLASYRHGLRWLFADQAGVD